ncbi:MAG: transcriptional repressor LexA [Candidatus Omnitrophota bacterium]
MAEQIELTQKQKKVLLFIRKKIKIDKLPPTIREIAKQFNFSSTGTVRDYLSTLVRKGYIKLAARRSRAIELIRPPLRLPIIGKVVAGLPDLAIEDVEGYLDLDRWLNNEDKIFLLRIKGDSMVEAGIMPDDLVLVKREVSAQDGQIVVALIESEATVKILRRRQGKVYLEPANKRYQPILVEKDSSIIGKVIAVIRKYV